MADLTSLWHAAAPPPPPPPQSSLPQSSSSNDNLYTRSPSPSKRISNLLRSISPSNSNENLSERHRQRSQSLQFDKYSKGDHLPVDTYSPEPENSKNHSRQRTMSYDQQPQQQQYNNNDNHSRQRTMSYDQQPQYNGSRTTSPVVNYTHHQQYPMGRQISYSSTSTTSSSSSTPRSPLPQPQQQHQQQQWNGYDHNPVRSATPSAYEAWQQQQQPHYSYQPQQPQQYHQQYQQTQPHQPLPHPAHSPQPSYPVQSPHSPQPPQSPLPPQYQTHPHSHTSPMPPPQSPTRSSTGTIRRALPRLPPAPATVSAQSQSQSQVVFPSGPPTGPAMTPATPPSPPKPRMTSHGSPTPSTVSLGRSDSVRMAAEELMSRGPPRRGTTRGLSRFSTTTTSSKSSPLSNGAGPTASQSGSVVDKTSQQEKVPSSQSEPSARSTWHQNVSSNSSSSNESSSNDSKYQQSLSEQFKHSTQIIEEPEPESDHISVAEPPPRPSSRGPIDDIRTHERSSNHIHESSPRSTKPATFASAQEELQQLAPRGEEIPKIFSPPPNTAPPVSFSFGDNAGPVISVSEPDSGGNGVHNGSAAPGISVSGPEDSSAAGGPVISISGPDDSAGPAISVSGPEDHAGPSISISGPEDSAGGGGGPSISVSGPEDNAGPAISISGPEGTPGMTPSVSLSHTSQHIPASPQRASATTSKAIQHNAVQHNGHPHSHPHPHAHQHAPNGVSRGHHHHTNGMSNGHTHTAPGPPPQTASSVAGAICGGCHKYIAGRVVQAIDQCFHPDCFNCNHCGELLEHVAFYEHQGKAYCHFDYHELFSLRCFHCRTPIVDERFIQISDPDLVSSNTTAASGETKEVPIRYYHDLHFFCANCGDPFMDPKKASSTAGSQRGQIQVDSAGRVISGSKAFVVWKGYPYCEGCHHNLHKSRCKSCKQPILGDVITALKGKWHPECFVCTGCKQPYPDEQVYVDSKGNGYDQECYKIWLRSQL
ncbi:unnamed protein product [Sympodiomycopsis kandeliae]